MTGVGPFDAAVVGGGAEAGTAWLIAPLGEGGDLWLFVLAPPALEADLGSWHAK